MARANGVRELWQAGKPVINSWLGIPSIFSAEVMANAGWYSLVVDMQHGMIDYQMMITMLQGISTTNTTPLVRVPWNDPAHIQKALDAGAYGIICPMINNRAEAEKFASSMRYAPLGARSSGPIPVRAGSWSSSSSVIAAALSNTTVRSESRTPRSSLPTGPVSQPTGTDTHPVT